MRLRRALLPRNHSEATGTAFLTALDNGVPGTTRQSGRPPAASPYSPPSACS
jgi:hypothetical protein